SSRRRHTRCLSDWSSDVCSSDLSALAAWSALLEAGRPCDITPYGLDALNTLRIEKGHVTSAELNGNTSADDLGLERLLKPRGDRSEERRVGKEGGARGGAGGGKK